MEELFRQASELKQNSDWQGALAVYEKIYADESQRNNQNLVLSMLSCLKKLEQYERAIEIGLPACELEGRWDAVASLTAWCIYFHHFKKPRQLSAEQAVEWLETIKRILPQSLGLHPLPLAVFSYLGNSPDLMPSLVVQICRLLDPDLLDTTKQPSKTLHKLSLTLGKTRVSALQSPLQCGRLPCLLQSVPRGPQPESGAFHKCRHLVQTSYGALSG